MKEKNKRKGGKGKEIGKNRREMGLWG